MLAAGLAILALASLYMFALGAAAVSWPNTAHCFLARFGQSPGANWMEAAVRSLTGAGALAAASSLPAPVLWQAAGGFLIVTSIWLVAFPQAHRRIALRSVAAVKPFMRLIGVASLVTGIALAAVILRAVRLSSAIPYID